MMNQPNSVTSYLTIRKIIGTLGLLLPVIVVIANECTFLPSISHYYYTPAALFFIAILSSFGLFLISYRGYEKTTTEKLSDNVITHIGGFAVLIVVLLPTACTGVDCTFIDTDFSNGFPLYGHKNKCISAIHLTSAGVFLFCMGWMALKRFTKGNTTKFHWYYKLSGYIIWICISLLALEFLLSTLLKRRISVTPYDVYILETVAVFFFGSSWLIKGKVTEDISVIKNKIKSFIKRD